MSADLQVRHVKWPSPPLATFSRDWPAEDKCSSKSATRPTPAAPSAARNQRGRAQPSPSGRPDSRARARRRRPAGNGLQSSATRMRGPLSGGLLGSPGRPLFSHLPLPVASRPRVLPLVLAADLRPPACPHRRQRRALARPPAGSRLPQTRASRRDFRFRRVLCVALREGAGGGGRREAALRRLCAPHYRTRGREGRCRPPPRPGPGACPASRLRTPRPTPATASPARRVTAAASARSGPADVLPPRRRQRVRRCLATPPSPARCSSPPRRNSTPSPRVSAASQRRAPHLHVTLTWTRIPPSPPAPLSSPCAGPDGRRWRRGWDRVVDHAEERVARWDPGQW